MESLSDELFDLRINHTGAANIKKLHASTRWLIGLGCLYTAISLCDAILNNQ